MTRMRTITQTIQYFQAKDPETAVTEFWLRNLLHAGAISYLKAGKKFLLNLDALEEYLACGHTSHSAPDVQSEFPKLRKITRIE